MMLNEAENNSATAGKRNPFAVKSVAVNVFVSIVLWRYLYERVERLRLLTRGSLAV